MGQSPPNAGLAQADKWTDPGYFSGRSRIANGLRLLVQLVFPPRGHRTLPTRAGILLITLTIGVGTAAFNTGQNVLYLALALMMSALLVSGLLSWFNFKGCRWRMQVGRHFRAGVVTPVYLVIQNSKRWMPCYALEFHLAAIGAGTAARLRMTERLDAGETRQLQWDYVPQRRGAETLTLQRMASAHPFGFLDKSIRESYRVPIVVWPARVGYRFAFAAPGERMLQGRHMRAGEGVELRQLRPYRPGDALRNVHWKATARMGQLQVRDTEQEWQQMLILRMDPSVHLWTPAAFETGCSFIASMAEDLFARGQLDGLHVVGYEPIYVREAHAVEHILNFLARLPLGRPKGAQGDTARHGLPDLIVDIVPGSDGRVLATWKGGQVGEAQP